MCLHFHQSAIGILRSTGKKKWLVCAHKKSVVLKTVSRSFEVFGVTLG